MKINATDYSLYAAGVRTHQPIKICESGLLNTYQGAKERKVELSIDENGSTCVISVDGKLRHIITAPFHIQIEEGTQKQ